MGIGIFKKLLQSTVAYHRSVVRTLKLSLLLKTCDHIPGILMTNKGTHIQIVQLKVAIRSSDQPGIIFNPVT